MAEVWPPSLPALLVADLVERVADTLLRTQMDAGRAKARQRFSAAPTPIASSMMLTGTQVLTFNAFFVSTLRGGTLPFTWTHPRTGESVTFQFVTQPEYRALAPRQSGTEYWRVTVAFEIVPSASGSSGGGGDDGAAWFFGRGLADDSAGAGDEASESITFLIPDGIDDDLPPAGGFWPGDRLLSGSLEAEAADAMSGADSIIPDVYGGAILPAAVGGGAVGSGGSGTS